MTDATRAARISEIAQILEPWAWETKSWNATMARDDALAKAEQILDVLAPTQTVSADKDAGEAIATAIELLDGYADFIRDDVRADDLERHPYLPLIEQTSDELRALTAPPIAIHGETFPREADHDLLLLRALLCLSGFAGEGLSVEGREDPADLYSDIVQAIGMEDADDHDLRCHIGVEQRRAALLQERQS